MKRAFLADTQYDERSAFRFILRDFNLQVVCEAAEWPVERLQATVVSIPPG